MAKSRNSETTINRILDVSSKLFLEKGYDKTTIQDIIDELGDLSKGAIYHHFKSKEDILSAVMDRLFLTKEDDMQKLRDQTGKTGLEKLREMTLVSLEDPNQDEFFSISPSLFNIPEILVASMKDAFETVLPEYTMPIIEEGIKDGSIKTEYPKELAEMLLLISNYWLNPLLFNMSADDLENKIKFSKLVLSGTGIDTLFDEFLDGLEKYRKLSEKA